MEWSIAQSHPFGKIDRTLLQSSEKSVRSRTALEKKDPRTGLAKADVKRVKTEADESEGEDEEEEMEIPARRPLASEEGSDEEEDEL